MTPCRASSCKLSTAGQIEWQTDNPRYCMRSYFWQLRKTVAQPKSILTHCPSTSSEHLQAHHKCIILSGAHCTDALREQEEIQISGDLRTPRHTKRSRSQPINVCLVIMPTLFCLVGKLSVKNYNLKHHCPYDLPEVPCHGCVCIQIPNSTNAHTTK